MNSPTACEGACGLCGRVPLRRASPIACQRSPKPRDVYAASVSWDRLAEICGQFLSKEQLIDVEGRLQTRQWDDDAGKPQCRVSALTRSSAG